MIPDLEDFASKPNLSTLSFNNKNWTTNLIFLKNGRPAYLRFVSQESVTGPGAVV